MDPQIKRITELYEEVKKLHDISESEMMCVMQMAMAVKLLGFSPKLSLKCMKVLTSFWEITIDEFGEDFEAFKGNK